jgi:hypothetical protein
MAVIASHDERVVTTAGEHASGVKANNAAVRRSPANRQVVMDQNGMEGVQVRTLQTPAKQRTEVTPNSVGAAVSQADSVKISPGVGMSEQEMLEGMTPEAREAYISKKAALRAQYVQDAPPANRHTAIRSAADFAPAPAATTVEVEGIRFATNAPPIAEEAKPTSDPRVKIARTVCADFPASYSFDAPPKKRIARLMADFDDRPDIIRAAFAAETDEGKALLQQEFPEAFGLDLKPGGWG